ncbi:MAG TPA: tetratricopeptide repeat protein [Rhodanobacteraceae bacterium]
MADGRGLLEELKRRHVGRVAIAYAVAGWLLVQVATQVFPFFSIPDWAVRLVVILIVIGFPVAVAFAWVYELTPEGIRRTEPADSPAARPAHQQRSVGQKLNAIIVAVLVLAVALLGWRLYAVQHVEATTPAIAMARNPNGPTRYSGKAVPDTVAAVVSSPRAMPAIPAKSVAVLPFTNVSGNQNEQFFSDGLSEDLITALSQFAGLKVISRHSAFEFRNSKENEREIGRKLGVAHLLEGSVQRAGDAVRITATLVNASDGTVLWTQRYDRPYSDLFALQDAITGAVADALKAKLLAAAGAVGQSDRPPNGSIAAYTAYQHGKAYYALSNEASDRRAIKAFGEAIRLDPRYAAAYAGLSNAWRGLAAQNLGGADAVRANAKAREAVTTALGLDPDSSLAHQARAFLLLDVDNDWAGAEAEAQRALQLAPGDAEAKFMLGNLLATLGQVGRAVELTRQALDSDPRHAGWYNWQATYATGLGRLDDAKQAIDTAIALQPAASGYYEQLAMIEILRGNTEAALAAARKENDKTWREAALALASQVGPDRALADAALKTLIADQANIAAYQVAEVYALRGDPGGTFQWLERAWANRDPGIGYLLYDPLVLRYRNDPRFAAFCEKVGLPTTTDAVAMKNGIR